MPIRLKTIIGIVLIETVALAIVIWSNLHVLVESNEQLMAEQARAVATITARPVANAYRTGPAAFEEEVRRLRRADSRITRIEVLSPGDVVPINTDAEILGIAALGTAIDAPRLVLAMDRSSMRSSLNSALIRSISIASLEIGASIAFSLWLAGWLLGRLENLQAASKRIAEGDFSERVRIEGNDEISDTGIAFNMMASRLSDMIERVRNETSRRESIEAELRVAREIQDALHPAACPVFPGHERIQVEAIDDPVREVAGDFYDWFAVDDRRLAVVIADVAGKGVPAGLFATACLTVIRTLARTGLEPTEVLDRANRQLAEQNREQMFATLSLLHLDVESGEIRAAIAGHPSARIMRKDGSIERVLARTGPIFGVLPKARWEETSCRLEIGERLVLVTDGVLEARDQSGMMLADDGFDEMLGQIADRDTAETARRIAWSVRTREGGEPYDDLTVVVMSRGDDGSRD